MEGKLTEKKILEKILAQASKIGSSAFMWTLVIVTGVIGGIIFLTLRITGRIRITGKKNIAGRKHKNTLLIANHPSMLEPILIPFAAFWPQAMINPFEYLPWQTPDKVNFVDKIPFLRFLRCIPVARTPEGERKDPRAYRKLRKILPDSMVLIFPEGTRSMKAKEAGALLCSTKSGIPIGQPRLGVGALIDNANPTIIPILVKGAEKVLPIHKTIPNFTASKIEIIFGEPFTFEPLPRTMPSHERYERYAKEAMKHIAALDR